MANGSITVHPSAVDEVNTYNTFFSEATSALGKGAESNTRYTFIRRVQEFGFAFLFDTSAIPANAEIVSVECRVKANVSNAGASGATASLRINASSIATETLGTSLGIVSLTSNAVSLADLGALRLQFLLDRNITVRYYGADLIVQYTYNNEQFYIKISGSWQPARKVYKKVGGLWVEQTELASVVEPGVKYKPG